MEDLWLLMEMKIFLCFGTTIITITMKCCWTKVEWKGVSQTYGQVIQLLSTPLILIKYFCLDDMIVSKDNLPMTCGYLTLKF